MDSHSDTFLSIRVSAILRVRIPDTLVYTIVSDRIHDRIVSVRVSVILSGFLLSGF